MIDDTKIKDWAEHKCDTHHGGACIGKVQWHVERRELARALQKAGAARGALAAVLVNLCHPLNQTEDWPPFSRKLQDAEDVLDQHMPSWREK